MDADIGIGEGDGEPRYRLLETIRQYSADRRAESAPHDVDRALRARHLSYFLSFCERANAGLDTGESARWAMLLTREQDNIRAAMTFALEHDVQSALALGAAMYDYAALRGFQSECRGWIDRALERSAAGVGPAAPVEARALIAAGNLSFRMNETAAARGYYERAMAIARLLGHPRMMVAALGNLANVLIELGDYAAAQPLVEESLSIYRQEGDDLNVAKVLIFQGRLDKQTGRVDAAMRSFQESLALYRKLSYATGVASALENIGVLHMLTGEWNEARRHLLQGLAIRCDSENRAAILRALTDLHLLEAASGNRSAAAHCLGHVLKLRREMDIVRVGPSHEDAESLAEAQQQITRELGREALAAIIQQCETEDTLQFARNLALE